MPFGTGLGWLSFRGGKAGVTGVAVDPDLPLRKPPLVRNPAEAYGRLGLGLGIPLFHKPTSSSLGV